ncbi:MAG: TlpA family protein disulfide reductase [Mariniphaga sp.]|nr:TlpA family protein disulfide reductase [Mariniphaga sp.]
MKRILLTNILLCAVLFLQAQTVIKNPEYGMSNAGNLEIIQIELNSNETVISFYISPQAGSFGIAAKSFIKVVGQPDSLFMTKQTAPLPEANGFIPIPPEGMSYNLYFPPIDLKVNRIDFGEPMSNGWYIYDIEIGKQPHISPAPKELLGNWFSTENNLWEYGFYDSIAVYDSKAWDYKSVKKEKDLYRISLQKGDNEQVLFIKTDKDKICWVGKSADNLKKYNAEFPGIGKMKFPDSTNLNENLFETGKVIYSGYINGFTNRIGLNSGIIRFTNPLTNNMESHAIKIDSKGTFTVEFQLDFPMEATISIPGGANRMFVEPGKTIFQYLNPSGSLYSQLVMGESAAVIYGMSSTTNIVTPQMEFLEAITEMSVKEYMNYVSLVKEKELEKLEQLRNENNLIDKIYQIRKLDINFRAEVNVLQFSTNKRMAVMYANQKLNKNEQLEYIPLKMEQADLKFIRGASATNPIAMQSSQYFNLLNRMKYTDLLSEYSSMYKLMIDLSTILEDKDIELSTEEKEMLEYIKIYMKQDYDMDVSRTFSQMYIDCYRKFQSKYSKEIQEISARFNDENFRLNAENIFGISEGLPFDLVRVQKYFRSTKNASLDLLTNEFNQAKREIKTDFLKEKVMADYYKRKTELELVATTDGVIYKNEADKFFDSLIKKYRGKVVYVDFWATWCGPCKDGIKRIKPLKEELADKDVVFVYITNPTSVENDYKKMIPDIKGEHYKVNADEWNLLTSKFNIYGIPHYALVDKSGKIINDRLKHMENGPLKELLMEEIEK